MVCPIPQTVAKRICQVRHYLHSYPGGALLNFGAFASSSLLGVIVFAIGPPNIRSFFLRAEDKQVICLSRFWLDDRLGRNSESHVLAVLLRSLRRHTDTKAIIAYSDPGHGHTGTIYRAAGFSYLGKSVMTPLYQLPDGSIHHTRSLAHALGTHNVEYLASHGIRVNLVPQSRKLIYVALLDPEWRQRLTRPILPYPKSGEDRCR